MNVLDSWLQLALERFAGLRRGQAGIHGGGGRLFSEQDPVALRLRQVAPRDIDVIAQRDQDVAQVLPLPRHWPRRHRTLTDGQRRVGDHGRFGHLVDTAQAMALRASALGRVRRKVFGVQHRLPGRVMASAGIEHADRTGQGGHAAHRGTCTRRAALLLQGHCRRQAIDGIDIRHANLVDQAPGIGRDRFEIAALGFGIQRGERQRRLARARHAGEHHQASRGISTSMFFRLCSRAPRTRMKPLGVVGRCGMKQSLSEAGQEAQVNSICSALAWATARGSTDGAGGVAGRRLSSPYLTFVSRLLLQPLAGAQHIADVVHTLLSLITSLNQPSNGMLPHLIARSIR